MPIVEFIDDQHESYMLQEQQPRRQKQLQSLTGDLDKEVRALLEPSRAAEIAVAASG